MSDARTKTPLGTRLFRGIWGLVAGAFGLCASAAPMSFNGSYFYSGSADRLSVTRKAEAEISLTGSGERWLLGFRGDNYSPFPDRKKKLRLREGFAEYQLRDSEWRVGTFQEILGTGLVFSSYRLRELDIENTVAGFRGAHTGRNHWSFLGFLAQGLENKKDNRVAGGNIRYEFGNGLSAAIEGLFSEEPSGAQKVRYRIGGIHGRYTRGFLDLTVEAAVLRKTGAVNRSGKAYYGYASWMILPHKGISIFGGYKDYKKFAHAYNLGPTLRSQFESSNYDDEVGYQVGIAYSPNETINIRINRNRSDSRGFPLPFRENEVTVHITPGNVWEEFYGYWRSKSDFTELEKDIEVNVVRRVSPQVKVILNYYAEDHHAPQQEYEVRQGTLGLHLGDKPIYLGGTIQRTTRASEPQRNWGYLEIHYPISGALRVQVFWGSDRGGRQCASGICVIRPPMEGNRLEIIGLF